MISEMFQLKSNSFPFSNFRSNFVFEKFHYKINSQEISNDGRADRQINPS